MRYTNAYADGQHLFLVRRAHGRVVVERTRAEYVSWHRLAETTPDLLRNLRVSRCVASVAVAGEWVRVGWRDERTRRAVIGAGAEGPLGDLVAYEGDVDPVRLWLTESGSEIARPRRVYIDLETDSDKTFGEAKRGDARVLSWAIIDEEGRKRCDVLEEDEDEAEAALLTKLWGELDAYDQVVCWNGSWGGEEAFDFAVLWARTAKLSIRVEPRRWLWVDLLPVFQRMNMHSAESGEEKRSLKLEDISQALLGRGKRKAEGIVPGKSLGAQTRQMWDAGGRWRATMLRYNCDDAELVRAIEAETGYLALFDTLCEVCRVFGNTDGLNPTGQMDGYMLRLGNERGYRFATRTFGAVQGDEQYKGAHVMKPKTQGIARDVHVIDFSSMYPSIIIAFNMGPDTKRQIPINGPVPEGHARTPTGVGFDLSAPSILVVALLELLRLRKYWSDKKASCAPGTPEWHDADRRSTAYKVAANSFYGVLGTVFSRFFDRQIAEAITQTGVWLIKRTNHEAEAPARGMSVVYTDTDGSYIQKATREQMGAFVDWCNAELYPAMLAAQGCRDGGMVKVAYEKQFDRIVFTGAKRYIGNFVHYKGKAATAESKPEIKGLEYKRGDAGRLGQQLQAEAIDMLVGGLKVARVSVPTERLEDYHAAVARMREHVLNDPLPLAEVVQSKSLSRGLRDYAQKTRKDGTPATQPPHVVVAKMLKERGRHVDEGMRVEYVVTDDTSDPKGLVPAEDYVGECDRYYLWETVVFAPTRRLLEAAFPGHDWASWADVRPKTPRAVSAKTAAKAAQVVLFEEPSVPRQRRRSAGA